MIKDIEKHDYEICRRADIYVKHLYTSRSSTILMMRIRIDHASIYMYNNNRLSNNKNMLQMPRFPFMKSCAYNKNFFFSLFCHKQKDNGFKERNDDRLL